MVTRIQKWGNSLALRIPKSSAAELGLEQGSVVEVSLVNRHLVVAPVEKPTVTLEQLLAQVTSDNLHGEVNTGPARGNEAW